MVRGTLRNAARAQEAAKGRERGGGQGGREEEQQCGEEAGCARGGSGKGGTGVGEAV